jgi:hypothetical protein
MEDLLKLLDVAEMKRVEIVGEDKWNLAIGCAHGGDLGACA